MSEGVEGRIERPDASSVVFENPEHDFPKKIFYRRQGPDSLVAGIEGPRGGLTRTINYPYRRIRCPGSYE